MRYTLPALADLEAVLDYIAACSPQAARRVQGRIQAVLELLTQHPSSAPAPTTRRMATLPYDCLIFYEATDAELIVHAVRHAAHDPSDMPGAS